jgi:hypothetical protein
MTLRAKINFASRLNRFSKFKPLRENNSLFPKHESGVSFARPASTRGALAIVTNVGSGMRWTPRMRKTSATGAYGEGVWSRSPDAGIKPRLMAMSAWRPTRRDFEATVARKPGSPRRARHKP